MSSALNMTCKENFHPPAVLFPVSLESKRCTGAVTGLQGILVAAKFSEVILFSAKIAESWAMSQKRSKIQIFCSTPPLIQLLAKGKIHYFFPAVPEKLWIPQGVFLKPFPKLLKITFYIQEFSRDLWVLLLIFLLKERSKFCFLHTCRTLCWVRFKLIELISTFFLLIF